MSHAVHDAAVCDRVIDRFAVRGWLHRGREGGSRNDADHRTTTVQVDPRDLDSRDHGVGRFEWSRRDVVDPAGDVDQCVIAQPGHVDGNVMDPAAGRDKWELLDGVDVDQIVEPGD